MKLKHISIFAMTFLCGLISAQDLKTDEVPQPVIEKEIYEESTYESKPVDYGYDVDWTPFQLGVIGRYQLFSKSTDVKGMRLGLLSSSSDDVVGISHSTLYSEANSIQGLDVTGISSNVPSGNYKSSDGVNLTGFISHRRSGFKGVLISGIANATSKAFYGIGVSSIYSGYETMTGLSVTGLFGSVKNSNGVMVSGVGNFFKSNADTINRGLFLSGITNVIGTNNDREKIQTKGAAISGVFNSSSSSFDGVQVSAVNYADKLKGIQIGLLNDAQELEGIQLGLFNFKDGKMRFPLINFDF